MVGKGKRQVVYTLLMQIKRKGRKGKTKYAPAVGSCDPLDRSVGLITCRLSSDPLQNLS
jgi:hypothetical protein